MQSSLEEIVASGFSPEEMRQAEADHARRVLRIQQAQTQKENASVTPTPYVSIDIETTGLDPEWCQILEIGAVIDDWVLPVEELPTFHCYVVHDRIIGDPFALSMPGNSKTLRRIAERKRPENQKYLFLKPAEVSTNFLCWLGSRGINPLQQAFTPSGKNFSGFDRQFLKRLPGFDAVKMHHRAIDPAMIFFNPATDTVPPGTEECLRRAGLPDDVAHTAVEDAIAVIKLNRFGTDFRSLLTGVTEETIDSELQQVTNVQGTEGAVIAHSILAYIRAHNGDPINKPSVRKEAARRLAEHFYQRRGQKSSENSASEIVAQA